MEVTSLYFAMACLLLKHARMSHAQIHVPMCDPLDDLDESIPVIQNGVSVMASNITKFHQPIKCHSDFELNLEKEDFTSAYLTVNTKKELDFAFQLGDFDYTIGPSHFCVWKNMTSYFVRTCHPTISVYDVEVPSKVTAVESCVRSKNVCVSKCCPLGQVVEIGPTEFGCAQSSTNVQFNPNFLFDNSTKDRQHRNTSALDVVVKFHYCKIYDPNYFTLKPNGSLFLLHTHEHFKPNAYCLDHFSLQGQVFGMRGSICSKTLRTVTTVELLGDTLRPFCLYLSIFCLSILLACHVVAPILRDFQGICYMNYIVAILLSNFFSYFVHKFFNWDSPTVACFVLFIISYGCMLTSTLWLVVMVFHVWESYRLLVIKNSTESHRLIKYYFFTWGTAFVFSIISIAIQLKAEEDPEGINIHKCSFPDSTTWLMMSNSISVTVLLILFAVVIVYAMALNLVVKFHTRINLSPSEVSTRNQASETIKGRLYLLLLATAIWIFELISAVTNEKMKLASAIIGSLQGFFISLEFFSSREKRKRVIEAIKKMRRNKGTASVEERQEAAHERGLEEVELSQPSPNPPTKNAPPKTDSDP